MDNNLILNSLQKLKNAVETENIGVMRALSSELIRRIIESPEEDIIALGMISYSLSKIFQKQHFKFDRRWTDFREKIIEQLSYAIIHIEEGNQKKIRGNLRVIFKELITIDSKVGHYVDWVIEKARIKQASTLYALGLSLGVSAELTGTTIWDLMEYTGKTKIVDEEKITVKLQKRLNIARKIFGGY